MPLVRKNIIANLIGSGWMALLSFIFIPFYIHFLGIESYGLIGFYSILLATLSRLNLGLKATLNRELAQRSALQGGHREMRDLVRSIEVVYWALAVLLMLLIIALSPLIVDHWININTISRTTALTSVMLMGVVFAFEFIFSMYAGGLIGLQKQVLQNGIIVTTSTLRFAGGVLVLWLISPTIEAFFFWQALVTLLQLGLGIYCLWHALDGTETSPRFRLELLKNIRRFASGMMGASILGFLLIQLPLIVLSKMLPLEEFAYYCLAMQVAFLLLFIIGPIITAVSPQLCALVSTQDDAALKVLYHKASQMVAVAILPVSSVLCFFSQEFLLAWTGNPQLVGHTYLLVILLALGSTFNGLVNMPFSLMIAYGWTRLIIQLNSMAVLLLVPLLIYMTPMFGAVGVAMLWLVLNMMWFLVGVFVLHRRYLVGELTRWYTRDVAVQMLGCVVVTMVARLFVEMPDERWSSLILLAGIWSCAFTVSVALSSDIRPIARRLMQDKIGIFIR